MIFLQMNEQALPKELKELAAHLVYSITIVEK